VTPIRVRERLKEMLGDRCAFDVPMAPLMTWRVGGKADCLARPQTVEELSAIMHICSEHNEQVRVVGAGSNILVLDGGLRGITILMRQGFDRFAPDFLTGDRVRLTLGAALGMNQAVDLCAQANIAGLEFIAGVPGSIGGGVRMNAGTTRGDFAGVLEEVEVVDADGRVRQIPREKLDYRYRGLVIDGMFVVTQAHLALRRGEGADIRAIADRIIRWRIEHHPMDKFSAGSTFKNPEGDHAGRLIEEAGLKGYTIGGAQVSEKHANFLINTGRATAADLLALIEHVRTAVHDQFGVMLEPEVKIWGERDVS